MKQLAVVLLMTMGCEAGCSLGPPAAAVPCHADTVQEAPGMFLGLSSGQTYQVYPTDNTTSMTWLPLDKLTVCQIGGSSVVITNNSERSRKIRAVRVYDLSTYVWPY